jgi:hypothetical protein
MISNSRILSQQVAALPILHKQVSFGAPTPNFGVKAKISAADITAADGSHGIKMVSKAPNEPTVMPRKTPKNEDVNKFAKQ